MDSQIDGTSGTHRRKLKTSQIAFSSLSNLNFNIIYDNSYIF